MQETETSSSAHPVPAPVTIEIGPVLDSLAERHDRAENLGVQVLNALNKPTDSLLMRLPDYARDRLEDLTARGLEASLHLARHSRRVVGHQKPWINTAAATLTGVVGGAGGLGASLAELPVTVTLLMRSVQAVAVDYGLDPDRPAVQRDCLLVFAASGPLSPDPGLEMSFLASRSTLTGATVHRAIALVAPRLAGVMGRKLAMQTVPVLGAASAVATNLSYAQYYQQMAHVVFGLRRLSIETGEPYDRLADALRARAEARAVRVSL